MTMDTKHGKRRQSAQATRGMVMTVLASQPETELGPCPGAEEMAALSEGRLAGQARQRVLDHVVRCPDCYREWLVVSAVVEKRAGTRRWVWAGAGGAAVVIGMALFLLWPGGPDRDVERAIDKVTANLQAMEEAGKSRELAMVVPGATRGRAPSVRDKAFRAGMFAGQGILSGKGAAMPLPQGLEPQGSATGVPATAWATTDQAPFYWLGRWAFAARAVCRATGEVSGENRRLLLLAARGLAEWISKGTGADGGLERVLRMLGDIEAVLDAGGGPVDCTRLTELLGRLGSGLSQGT